MDRQILLLGTVLLVSRTRGPDFIFPSVATAHLWMQLIWLLGLSHTRSDIIVFCLLTLSHSVVPPTHTPTMTPGLELLLAKLGHQRSDQDRPLRKY